MKRYLETLRHFDWLLFGAIILLIAFSLASLYSIAVSSETPDFSIVTKQAIAAAIGIAVIFILIFVDYRFWIQTSQIFYIGAAALLALVLFFGQTISGTTGWFSFFGFSFQPVEIAKVALITVLAWYISTRIASIRQIKTFLTSSSFALGMFVLVLFQPDFGSGIILMLIWFVMVALAGADRKQLLAIILLVIISAVGAWFFFFQDYQKDRIVSFLNPEYDPYGRGYQVRQAIIAVGAGGVFGRGLGFGSQSQLKFIPASQTDFIFAVIAEELGFLGVGFILFLWALIFYRISRAVARSKDAFASLFMLGISAMFFIQIMVNIGMNIGLVPVTGIPLPLLSAGGSFMIISMVAFGIIQSMIVRNRA